VAIWAIEYFLLTTANGIFEHLHSGKPWHGGGIWVTTKQAERKSRLNMKIRANFRIWHMLKALYEQNKAKQMSIAVTIVDARNLTSTWDVRIRPNPGKASAITSGRARAVGI
jgi:hypothetical protein